MNAQSPGPSPDLQSNAAMSNSIDALDFAALALGASIPSVAVLQEADNFTQTFLHRTDTFTGLEELPDRASEGAG